MVGSSANDGIGYVDQRIQTRHRVSSHIRTAAYMHVNSARMLNYLNYLNTPVCLASLIFVQAITVMQNGNVDSVVTFVLLQIEAVKFAMDWQYVLSAKGGRKFISAFYKTAFMEESSFSHHFHGLTDDEIVHKFKTLKAVFQQWRRSAGQVVTARNRLLRLYGTVSYQLPCIISLVHALPTRNDVVGLILCVSSSELQSSLIPPGPSRISSRVAPTSSYPSGSNCRFASVNKRWNCLQTGVPDAP